MLVYGSSTQYVHTGMRIAAERMRLPPPNHNEHYWQWAERVGGNNPTEPGFEDDVVEV